MSTHIPPSREPDEQFLDAFEQQLRAGIRRRALLDTTTHTLGADGRKGKNMLATAALMLVSLMLGATGTFAVVHQDLAPHRELHLQRATILLERAQVTLERRTADLAELETLFEEGLADHGAAAQARGKVVEARSEVRRRELDLEETRTTGRAPVDELTAPLVAATDFVTARLQEQLRIRREHVMVLADQVARTEELFRQGVISEQEILDARANLEAARPELIRVEQRIELRRSFLDGKTPAPTAELQALLRDMEADRAVAATRLQSAMSSLERIAALYEHGVVRASDVRSAEAAVRDAESSLALAEVQLEMIRQRLAPAE